MNPNENGTGFAPNETVCDYYRKRGFSLANEVEGNDEVLKIELSTVLRNILDESKKTKEIQDAAKRRLEQEIEHSQEEILEMNEKLVSLKDRILEIKNTNTSKISEKEKAKNLIYKEIEKAKNSIKGLKEEEENLLNQPGKLSILGKWSSYVLFFLTLYLVVFYIFAIHGVFMREFDAGFSEDFTSTTGIGTSLFSATPIYDAWNSSGVLGVFLIFLAPIVFLSIGLTALINSYNRDSNSKELRINYYYAIGPIVVAFFLDGLIAKHIVDKVHIVNFESNLVESPPQWYSFLLNTEFYIIMLFGFVAYLVWAVILNHYSKEKGKANMNKNKIKYLEEEIIECESKIKDIDVEITELQTLLNNESEGVEMEIEIIAERTKELQDQIMVFQERITREDTIPVLPKMEFSSNLDCLLSGWCKWISKEKNRSSASSLIKACIEIKENYFKEVLASNEYTVIESLK